MKWIKLLVFTLMYCAITVIQNFFIGNEIELNSFYLGVTQNNNLFTEMTWFGPIFILLIVVSRDVKSVISKYLYITIIRGKPQYALHYMIKQASIVTIAILGVYGLAAIIISQSITNILLINGLLVINLVALYIIMIALNFKFDFNFSLIGMSIFLVVATVFTGTLYNSKYEMLTLLFPLNQTMYYRQTDYWLISYAISILYLIISYIIARVVIKNSEYI